MEQKGLLEIATDWKHVLRFALPTILSNILMNVYTMVDQLFVSNISGTDALSAVSIFSPVIYLAMAVGIMVATGGSALAGKRLGEGRQRDACSIFSFLFIVSTAAGLLLCSLALVFRSPLLHALGTDETLYPICVSYAVPYLAALPVAMGGMYFSVFYAASGYPQLGFGVSCIGGALNIALDWVLIPRMGVAGAAWASSIGYITQTVIGLCFFSINRTGLLYLVKPRFDWKVLSKSCSNGMSEMVSVLSTSTVMIVMNIILMRLSGSDAVAAAAIALTVNVLLTSAFMGYAQGIAPLVSYNYGKDDIKSLQGLYRSAMRTVAAVSVLVFLLMFPLARPLALVFTRDKAVLDMAVHATWVFAFAALLMGFNVFSSSLFTALNDGRTSAVISFCRTFVFLLLPLLVLPVFLGMNGVWLSLPVAEALSRVLSSYFLKRKRSIYHYA